MVNVDVVLKGFNQAFKRLREDYDEDEDECDWEKINGQWWLCRVNWTNSHNHENSHTLDIVGSFYRNIFRKRNKLNKPNKDQTHIKTRSFVFCLTTCAICQNKVHMAVIPLSPTPSQKTSWKI